LKECLKQDETVSECVRLDAEIKSLAPLRCQLKDYKVQAIDTKLKLAECQESLKQCLSINLNRQELLQSKATLKEKVVIYPSINEGMSKLNQAVIEEVVRLRIEKELLRESAGQNSDYAAWEVQMDPKCHTLLGRMHSNNNKQKRFYPLLVNAVMAINIMDQDLQLV
jgi:hypothetical protein